MIKREFIFNADQPIVIDPATMLHSIVITQYNEHTEPSPDYVQQAINPKFWCDVRKGYLEKKVTALNHLAQTSGPAEPGDIAPIIETFQIPDNTSVFIRGATISFDGGKTEQRVFACIVFPDSNPRMLVSTVEPIAGHVEPQRSKSSEKRKWWKLK